jgi:hypothetical protein
MSFQQGSVYAEASAAKRHKGEIAVGEFFKDSSAEVAQAR